MGKTEEKQPDLHSSPLFTFEAQTSEEEKLLCKSKRPQFTVDLHRSSLHFKFDAQFWDVLFSTISLTCLLSLSFSIIQAQINTQHTPVREKAGGRDEFKPESGLWICINLCVATQPKNLWKTQ